MRIAIAEDKKEDADHLTDGISRWALDHQIPLIPHPVLFADGESLLDQFQAGSYDIIFLDIFMNGINGMETAQAIRKTDPYCRLIFTTISDGYAVDSYDVESSGYLLKPYSYEKLSQALIRCNADLIEQSQYVTVPDKNGIHKLFLHQITWTEYADRQICVHVANGEAQYIRMRQREFASLLLQYPYFCDCMKGILVNLESVENLTENCLRLQDGTVLPVSRLKYPAVRQKYLDFAYSSVRSRIRTYSPEPGQP